MVLALWCVLVAVLTITPVYAATSNSTKTSTATPTVTTAAPSVSTSSQAAVVTDTPVGTVAAATTATTTASSVDTAYICSGDEVARLTKLNENNPYLQSACTDSAGISSYVFPFNGELSYAQMVAMSSVSQCNLYFRAVLLVQLQECVDANVYIRTTVETILQLGATSGTAPTEAQVNAAIAVRKAYNLALRDGGGSASYSAMSGASELTWNIEGDTIDTTASATKTGQLLLSTDLKVIGTYYASSGSFASTTSTIEDSRTTGDSSGAVRREALSWLVAAAVGACTALLLNVS
ncbi:hypothetical protein PF005_g11254 [Phytophthora fragariae]|uniref:Elicitin n=1 Tax=Phytophthora fragariae TaxID=53985 RepID=A0A6A3S743_9STRA|nr:hypothetical protein PF003_g4012 [Phytophthora fragariae]KAE8937603.1 hypothetical protein PF009_g12502 [Phytophthora fragariae]KAE9009420.1 hypothetical protein PF011_g10278 [Phytophthora fragariae]KAE9111090.1 hypothetical protein PF007_g11614 [Phytophthora fragariae]KAE9111507.1 hypothetical protein PF010_g10781 [Phytophthora fragariae]